MKPATKPLPRIRVTKLPPGTKNETASKDLMTWDLILSVVNSVNRVRNRCDGIEARLQLLEGRGDR